MTPNIYFLHMHFAFKTLQHIEMVLSYPPLSNFQNN